MGKWSGSPGRVGPARVFREFAVASGAFFASAEIQRGMDWSGQGLGYGPETERTIYLAPGGKWCGLVELVLPRLSKPRPAIPDQRLGPRRRHRPVS
jgi:hypothetical protein